MSTTAGKAAEYMAARIPADRWYSEEYRPATDEVASRRLRLVSPPGDDFLRTILDPSFPLVVECSRTCSPHVRTWSKRNLWRT